MDLEKIFKIKKKILETCEDLYGDKEIWKDIKGYEGVYQVSNFGRIKSIVKYKKLMLSSENENGYLRVCLIDKNKKKRTILIHRLVAKTFEISGEEMGQIIAMLKSAAEAMTDVADEMKETVKNVLLTSGLSGDTANSLAEAYDNDVLTTIRKFDEELTDYIAKNETVYSDAQDLSSKTKDIASSAGMK